MLEATIGTDALIHHLFVVSGPQALIDAAVAKRPYLIEGNPMEVDTTIKIQFRM